MLYFDSPVRSRAPRVPPSMNDTPGRAENSDPDDVARDAGAARRERLNQLLLSVAQGNQQAFAEFYRLTSSRVFGVIVRMLHDTGEAEDVLQEVYTSAWRRADSFDPARAGAMTWLVTLARNRAIDRLRQHRETQLDDSAAQDLPDDDTPSPAALAEASQERRRLQDCLDQLGAQQRHAVRDAFFSGATYAELAERLSVPLGTMKSWIRRSLMQLKLCLER
ncbi:putative RNA polymerase sigma-70 factor, ECF subfamily [Burkholderia plantarii]|uniref:Putative RNA polymerase sigma-70 factor, ECF subfamily n=2 Tax=Burkholderia plantarii TaxID=41899 RepID=A0A0B6SBF0_BURPL|nr:putative RNA polymerase sigma-70 factor, ECF subfamily [Burkholderia plantarii]